MANFLKNGFDKQSSIHLYRPDYSFLTKVYGTKQEEFNKGFNAVKSIYDSALNQAITNTDNISHREEILKKLNASIKSIANTDLTKSENINQAISLLDPLSKDKELVYDRYVTDKNLKEYTLLESYKNNADPEKRRMYNPYSAMSIQFSNEDLKNAKRGDGSIMDVKEGKFVPLQDINEFLDKKAKDQGLEITRTEKQGGYLIEYTNGKGAVIDFQMWAKAQLSGGQFDEQLRLMGEMQAESLIRDKMKEGISRADATREIAKQIYPKILENNSLRGIELQEELANIKSNIEVYEVLSEDKLKDNEDYKKLKELEEVYKEALLNKQNDIHTQQQEGTEFITRNLNDTFTTQAFINVANTWGKAKAMSKAKTTVKVDQFVINELNRISRENIARQRLNLDKLKLDVDNNHKKYIYDLKLKEYQLKLNEYKLKLAEDKKKGVKVKNKEVKNEEVKPEDRFNYITDFVSEKILSASDIVQKTFDKAREGMFNSVTSVDDGLINIVDPKNSHRNIQALIKLKNATESESDLDDNTKATITTLANKIGLSDLDIDFDYSGVSGKQALDLILVQLYKAATNKKETFFKSNIFDKNEVPVEQFRNNLNHMRMLMDERNSVREQMKAIGNAIDNNNREGELYDGAKLIGVDHGEKIYDISGLSKEGKESLNSLIDREYRNKRIPIGSTYTSNDITDAEALLLLDEKKSINIEGIDSDMLKSFNIASLNEKKDYLGGRYKATFDPANELVYFTFNKNIDSKLAKDKKDKKEMEFRMTIPYATIRAESSLNELNEKINENSIDYSTLANAKELLKKGGIIESSDSQERRGFKYSAIRDDNKINIHFELTDSDGKISYKNTTINNVTSVSQIRQAIEAINRIESMHSLNNNNKAQR